MPNPPLHMLNFDMLNQGTLYRSQFNTSIYSISYGLQRQYPGMQAGYRESRLYEHGMKRISDYKCILRLISSRKFLRRATTIKTAAIATHGIAT